MSTQQAIQKHLQSGKSLTTLQSLNKFKTYRLSEYVRRLKAQGMNIKTERMSTASGKTYARYQVA